MATVEPKTPAKSSLSARLLLLLLAALPLVALGLALVANVSGLRDEGEEEQPVAEVEVKDDAQQTTPPAEAAQAQTANPAAMPAVAGQQPANTSALPEPQPAATTEPAATKVAENPPAKESADSIAKTPESKRELVVQELSKEVYNALSELRAMVESEAWDDAARFVAGIKPETATGLAPYFADKSLLVSLPVAVQLALEDEPQLWQTMTEDFAPLARLRIGEAIRSSDAVAIELATVQFAGTAATADAHRWLGDQALVAGWFSRAIKQYELATENANDNADETAPRLRLAAAMLGRDAGMPASGGVRFGDVTMTAAEFEALVAEMKSRGSATVPPANRGSTAIEQVPQPSGFTSHTRSKLDGAVGLRPQEEGSRRTSPLRIPWVDRQIATVVDGPVLFVTNRFQLAAFDLTTGERKWQRETPPERMLRSQDWALIPMRPLVIGERIFTRMLFSESPFLAGFEKSTGKILWTTENRERELLVSDPLLIDGELVALSLLREPDQRGLLRYCVFDPQWGQMVKQRNLVRLRGLWGERACCEVSPIEGGLVASLGGATLAVDRTGQVRWVRAHENSALEDDPRSLLQTYQPPLVHNGRVYVVQPGVRAVECMAAVTGRKHWSAALPDVVSVVGLANNLLVIRTERGLCGLKASDGTIAWQTAMDDLFSFPLLDKERLLVASRERTAESSDEFVVRLTWLNPTDGQRIETTLLNELKGSDPRLGPLIPVGNRLFTFFGNGQNEATRDVLELVPNGRAETLP